MLAGLGRLALADGGLPNNDRQVDKRSSSLEISGPARLDCGQPGGISSTAARSLSLCDSVCLCVSLRLRFSVSFASLQYYESSLVSGGGGGPGRRRPWGMSDRGGGRIGMLWWWKEGAVVAVDAGDGGRRRMWCR